MKPDISLENTAQESNIQDNSENYSTLINRNNTMLKILNEEFGIRTVPNLSNRIIYGQTSLVDTARKKNSNQIQEYTCESVLNSDKFEKPDTALDIL